jgi:hypothetical protein
MLPIEQPGNVFYQIDIPGIIRCGDPETDPVEIPVDSRLRQNKAKLC